MRLGGSKKVKHLCPCPYCLAWETIRDITLGAICVAIVFTPIYYLTK